MWPLPEPPDPECAAEATRQLRVDQLVTRRQVLTLGKGTLRFYVSFLCVVSPRAE